MADSESRTPVSRAYRLQAGLVAVLDSPSGGVECRAEDLSRTGVLLIGDLPSSLTSPVRVRIRSRSGDLEGSFLGRVARVEPHAGGKGLEIGIEFLDVDRAQEEILASLLARLMEGLTPGPLQSVRPGAPIHEVRKALEAVPLSHRVALAVRSGPKERELLRVDPHPQVLESLARNPNLTLAEAQGLASNLLILPSTLEILASDPRFTGDHEIRILIASHPRVSVPLAERIVAALPPPALRKALARPSLHPAIRDRILRRLARG